MREYACGRGARVGAVQETDIEPWLAAAEAQLAARPDAAPADEACAGYLACEGPIVAGWATGAYGARLRVCHTTCDTAYVCSHDKDASVRDPRETAARSVHATVSHTESITHTESDRQRDTDSGRRGGSTVYNFFAYPAYDNCAGERRRLLACTPAQTQTHYLCMRAGEGVLDHERV
jgi:hypothetical protein